LLSHNEFDSGSVITLSNHLKHAGLTSIVTYWRVMQTELTLQDNGKSLIIKRLNSLQDVVCKIRIKLFSTVFSMIFSYFLRKTSLISFEIN
jgi:hypothetical protein